MGKIKQGKGAEKEEGMVLEGMAKNALSEKVTHVNPPKTSGQERRPADVCSKPDLLLVLILNIYTSNVGLL